MKILFASDIHGSARWCERMVALWHQAAPERLLLLGDLLYHGPRNDLPEDYRPKAVIALLNALNPAPLCVRGNCEAEVDQMVLNFPVMADYAWVPLAGRVLYLTHGHVYNPAHPPRLAPGDILLYGHTHVPDLQRREGFTCVNPGSVAIPKDGSPHSLCLLEDGEIRWIDLADGAAWRRERLW